MTRPPAASLHPPCQPPSLVREDMPEEQRAQLVNEAIRVLLGETS